MASYMISTLHTVCNYAGNMTKKNERSGSHGTYVGVVRCIQRLVGKYEGKRPLGNPRRRGTDNIKVVLSNGIFDPPHYKDNWRAFVNTVMDLRGT